MGDGRWDMRDGKIAVKWKKRRGQAGQGGGIGEGVGLLDMQSRSWCLT